MEENCRWLQELMASYPAHPRFLLPILQDIQSRARYLPADAMKAVAKYLGIPDNRVFAVATFYKSLSLTSRGEKQLKICMGTACHLRGAGEVLARFEQKLNVKNGETTPDGKFSIETVNCLGACALAPVVMVDDEAYGTVTAAKIDEIVGERP